MHPNIAGAFTLMYAEGRRWLSDAMAAAGRVAGVLAGLEVARLLRAEAIELPFTFEVIDFLSEESSDFGMSCIGSRALAGRLSSQDLSRRDLRGTRLADAIEAVGGRTAAIGSPMRQHGSLVRLRGAAAHSGTTSMNHRRDALAGVAELILSVERLARERSRDGEFVGTVGQLTVVPGGANVVPGETTATVELRALEDRTLDEAELELREDARDQAAGRGLELAFDEISRTAPVELDPDLRALLARAARAAGTHPLELSSGGGHDAGHVAAIAPSAMLFIPCRDGVSHAPEEAAEPEHIALGADVLLRVLVELAGRPCS